MLLREFVSVLSWEVLAMDIFKSLILVTFFSPSLSLGADERARVSLTLDKDSGGVNTAFYGGMVKNKLLYSYIKREGDSEIRRNCWFGTAPGVSGVLVKEKIKFYQKAAKKKKESRVEQSIYVDGNLANAIKALLGLYKAHPNRFIQGLDSDKRTITLGVLKQSSDTELARLAQNTIKKIERVCDKQI